MAFEVKMLIVALAFVSATSARVIPTQEVYQGPGYDKQSESHAAHSKYKFSYAINDEHTGDVKSQFETRDGDVVHGEYSLIDADGFKRIVQYSADPVHGFKAVVQREPLNHAPAQIIKAAPVTHTAPAPVIYATAQTLIKSAPSTYATVPTQDTYARQSHVKSGLAAHASAPAIGTYDKQPLNKKSPAVFPAQQAQSFGKAVAVTHVGKPTQRSYVKQSAIKPVKGAYVSQTNVKSVPTSYGSRSSHF